VLKNKPAIFGDLQVNADEILDGGKDLPYRLVTNSQGLRLNYNVTFPKKKQRILLFGDSVFFCPFLDNEDGIAQQLQAMYPDAEIINTANWGYSIDDYLSLYQEKAKFLEADLVIVQTSGNDIMDYYFSNRLKLSRNKTNIQPSEAELALYKELYNK
jgi:lysophospholipase L1-like esterase